MLIIALSLLRTYLKCFYDCDSFFAHAWSEFDSLVVFVIGACLRFSADMPWKINAANYVICVICFVKVWAIKGSVCTPEGIYPPDGIYPPYVVPWYALQVSDSSYLSPHIVFIESKYLIERSIVITQ